MSACSLLTGGFLAGENNCNQVAAGVYHNRIWLANLEEILAWGSSATPNQYDALTFGAGDGLFALKLDKDSVIWREEYDPETKSWYHEFSGKVADLGITARNFIESLAGPDIVAILELKAGVFKIIGKDAGAKLFSHVGTSDQAEVGNMFSIRAENMSEPCPHFWDTNESTTLALLQSYESTT
jgi:hypothetical protein